jgi:hypothetical protein
VLLHLLLELLLQYVLHLSTWLLPRRLLLLTTLQLPIRIPGCCQRGVPALLLWVRTISTRSLSSSISIICSSSTGALPGAVAVAAGDGQGP